MGYEMEFLVLSLRIMSLMLRFSLLRTLGSALNVIFYVRL